MKLPSSLLVFTLVRLAQVVEAQNCGQDRPCAQGLCCSQWGYCGTGAEYCGSDPTPSPPTPQIGTRPKFGNVPYGSIISSCTSPGKIALTYDDGPWTFTSQLLDTLSSLRAPATFFVIGQTQDRSLMNTGTWPNLIKRMVSEGHQVASHTFSHQSMWSIPRDSQISELVRIEELFLDILGYYPTYFRCPYLECDGPSGSLGVLGEYGYHVIGTNSDTKDYMYDSPDQIFNAKNNFANGVSANSAANSYITLMHDVKYQTVAELTRFTIETARARGYQLVTVGECLGDDKGNWYRKSDGSALGGGGGGVSPPAASPTNTPSPTTLITSAVPGPTKVSTDGSCGASSGSNCVGSSFGGCCSQYGWCGSTTDYCGTGCNRAWGTCN